MRFQIERTSTSMAENNGEINSPIDRVVYFGNEPHRFSLNPNYPLTIEGRELYPTIDRQNQLIEGSIKDRLVSFMSGGILPEGFIIVDRGNWEKRTRNIDLLGPDGYIYTINGFGLGFESEGKVIYTTPQVNDNIRDYDRKILGSKPTGHSYFDRAGDQIMVTDETVLGGVQRGGLNGKIENGNKLAKIFQTYNDIHFPEWVLKGEVEVGGITLDWGVYRQKPNLTPLELAKLTIDLTTNPEEVHTLFYEYCFLFGQAMRHWHKNGWIHGQPHPGNIGISWEGEQMQLHIYDLETALNITNHPRKSKEEGRIPAFHGNLLLDIETFLRTSINPLLVAISERNGVGVNIVEMSKIAIDTIEAFFGGYLLGFGKKYNRTLLKNLMHPIFIEQLTRKVDLRGLITRCANTIPSPDFRDLAIETALLYLPYLYPPKSQKERPKSKDDYSFLDVINKFIETYTVLTSKKQY